MADNWPSFDQLRAIAEQGPEALERFRQDRVDTLIANAPEEYQRRLRGLQFQVDCTIRRHKTPMGACISISQMMQESLARLNQALHGFNGSDDETDNRESAAIIAFPAAS